jgi:hypothetical protein
MPRIETALGSVKSAPVAKAVSPGSSSSEARELRR